MDHNLFSPFLTGAHRFALTDKAPEDSSVCLLVRRDSACGVQTFLKGPDGTFFRLVSHMVCHNYFSSALLESGYKQYRNKLFKNTRA